VAPHRYTPHLTTAPTTTTSIGSLE
jgi:hypothetical protein